MQGRRGSAPWANGLRWLVACWALAWALAPASAAAVQDRVLARAYWAEPCAEYGVGALPQQDFRPFEGVLAQGYGRCAIWVRLQLAAADGPTVLRIQPTYLDEIALHDPLLPGVVLRGDRYPREAGTQGRALRFTVPGGAAPRDVWLRLSTTSTRMLDLQAVSPQDAQTLDERADWVQGSFLLLLAVPLPWAILQWFHLRERLLAVFAAKQTAMLAWALMVMGYGPGLLGAVLAPPAIDQLTSVLAMAVITASIWFELTLLSGYRVPRWGPWLMRTPLVLLPILLVMLFSGRAAAALEINITLTWLGALLATVLYLLARRPNAQGPQVVTLPPKVLAAYTALSLAALTLAVGLQLGLLAGSPLIMSSLFSHGVLSSVVMLVLLNVRAGMQARAVGALAAAQARAQQEQLHREEQERLVGMLVHEMRTPLATVRMALGQGPTSPQQSDSVQRSLADMNGLLERCAQASQLDGGGLQPQWTRCDLWQAVQDISGDWRDAQRLVLHPPTAPSAQVQADPDWLRIILGNLIDNACKYSPAGSRVQVTLQPADGQLGERTFAGFAVAVANLPGAAGWPDAQQLFAKYYRSPFARRSTGSGLGLYLVAGLAQRLNGEIRYEPTPEQIRFCLWLPS